MVVYKNIKMDYTLEDGKYFKILNTNDELLTFGRLMLGQILSTIHNVIFITRSEYLLLVETEEIS